MKRNGFLTNERALKNGPKNGNNTLMRAISQHPRRYLQQIT